MTKILKTYKYKLCPSKAKEQKLVQALGVCRLIYNLCLEYKSMLWNDYSISLSKGQLEKEVKELSKEFNWMGDVHSQVRQKSIHRLLRTYDNFFNRGAGFPKYAKKGFFNSFTYPQGVKINGNYVYLPKIGWLKFFPNQILPDDAKIKTVSLVKEPDGWHICVSIETAMTFKYAYDDNQVLGIDIGVRHYYTDSNGKHIENPRFLDKFAQKIRRLNRKLARQKKGSKRRDRTKVVLQKTYQKLRRKRSDYIHKLTHHIVKENSIIIVEDLQLKNMTKSAKGTSEAPGKNVKQKSGLNRVLLDLSTHEFYRQLEYKSKWYARKFIKVNPAYTSQECFLCGHSSKENRQTQSKFECTKCGHISNADVNAAQNIKRRGLACCR